MVDGGNDEFDDDDNDVTVMMHDKVKNESRQVMRLFQFIFSLVSMFSSLRAFQTVIIP